MAADSGRDDFIIAIRSAFLKKGTRQNFSLLTLLIISILVLGVSTQSSGPGPLVSHITSRGASTCRVPVTLVPDVMTDEAIDALT